MNQVNKYIFITLLIIFPFTSSAQNEQNVKLAIDEFIKMVKQYHPIAKQADFLVSNAKANKLKMTNSTPALEWTGESA